MAFYLDKGEGIRGWLLFNEFLEYVIVISAGLAVFNLLPASWLDGGRILESLLAWKGREELGRQATDLCAFLVAALLLAGGMLLFWQSGGRNFTILVAGLWMTGAAWRESGTAKRQEVKKR